MCKFDCLANCENGEVEVLKAGEPDDGFTEQVTCEVCQGAGFLTAEEAVDYWKSEADRLQMVVDQMRIDSMKARSKEEGR